MKYTLFYLKCLVMILLVIIMLFSCICGIVLIIAGLFSSLMNRDAYPLILIFPGLFCGFMCFVAVDCANYISDKWSWEV